MIKIQENQKVNRCPNQYDSELVEKLNDVFKNRACSVKNVDDAARSTWNRMDVGEEYQEIFSHRPFFYDKYGQQWFSRVDFWLDKKNGDYLRFDPNKDVHIAILLPNNNKFDSNKSVEVCVGQGVDERSVEYLLEEFTYSLSLQRPRRDFVRETFDKIHGYKN